MQATLTAGSHVKHPAYPLPGLVTTVARDWRGRPVRAWVEFPLPAGPQRREVKAGDLTVVEVAS